MEVNKEQKTIELKHFLSDINDLRIHESKDNLSEWGKDKLKEYEFILTELEELKKIRFINISEDCIIHNTDFNGKCFKCSQQVFTRDKL